MVKNGISNFDLRVPLFYLILCSPLLVLFTNNKIMKLFILGILTLLIGLLFLKKYLEIFKNNLINIPLQIKVFLGLLIVFVLLSFIYSEGLGGRKLFGSQNDYLGLYTWIILFVSGVFYSDIAKNLFTSKFTYYVFCIILISSLIIDRNNLINLTGLYSNTFSLGLISCLLLILSFYKLKNIKLFGLLISIFVIILSFDIINLTIYFALLGYLVYKNKNFKSYIKNILYTITLAVIIFINIPNNLSLILQNRFDLFAKDQINIYQITGKKIANNSLFVGKKLGEKSLGKVGVVAVPKDISKQLKVSNRFTYSNSLWLNMFRYFGIIFVTLFLLLNYYLFYLLIKGKSEHSMYLLMYILFFINTLLNNINLEILVLFFMITFGLTEGKSKAYEKI